MSSQDYQCSSVKDVPFTMSNGGTTRIHLIRPGGQLILTTAANEFRLHEGGMIFERGRYYRITIEELPVPKPQVPIPPTLEVIPHPDKK